MESILLEDVRPKSTSQFKMIVSSRAASEVSAVALSSGSISPRANEASTVANEVSLKVELRPRQGYQNITVKLTRPRIYIVPSFMLALIDLGLPLIKQLLRAQEVFETRQNFGNAADAQRDVLVEEGNLKQKQLAEYQSVVKENNLLLKKLEGKLAVIQNATMSPNPQVEMAIIEEIQNAKTAHQRKIRTLRHLHQEQLKKFKGIATDLLVAASTKMESATEVLKKAASGEEVKGTNWICSAIFEDPT
jgi:rRNA-processing protein FCF1